nr:hypothetical protein [Providencia rettgeri]
MNTKRVLENIFWQCLVHREAYLRSWVRSKVAYIINRWNWFVQIIVIGVFLKVVQTKNRKNGLKIEKASQQLQLAFSINNEIL